MKTKRLEIFLNTSYADSAGYGTGEIDMEKLDYYDDETIMKKIKFFKIKKLFRLSPFSPFIPLITVFWSCILKKCENSDFRNINVFIGVLLLCINVLLVIKYFFALFSKDITEEELKEKYLINNLEDDKNE